MPLLTINLPLLHHVLYVLFDFPKSLFVTLMGDWAVVMPNRPGEDKTTYSQALLVFLLPSIIIRRHQRTAEVSLAAEDGYSVTAYSTGKCCVKHYIHAKFKSDTWTMDKRLNMQHLKYLTHGPLHCI